MLLSMFAKMIPKRDLKFQVSGKEGRGTEVIHRHNTNKQFTIEKNHALLDNSKKKTVPCCHIVVSVTCDTPLWS